MQIQFREWNDYKVTLFLVADEIGCTTESCMCSVFFISALVMDFIHGQVAAELQVWNAIVSLNEVAEERLGGCSKEEGRVRASNFSSVYQPTRCSMQQMSNDRNRVHFLYCRCEGV